MTPKKKVLEQLKKVIKMRVADKEAQAEEWRVYGQFGEHYLPDNFGEDHVKLLRKLIIEAEEAGIEESLLIKASAYL